MARRFAPLFAAAVLGLATLGLSACNTMAGAGKDVSAAGHDVTRGANATGNAIDNNTGASKD